MLRRLLLLVWCTTCLAQAGPALHLSVTEVEYNRPERRATLAVRVFPADLEAALSAFTGRKITVARSDELAPVALAYLRQKLRITPARGEPSPLEWAGIDVSDTHVWIFLETSMTGGLRGARFGNTIMHELYKDQINTMKLHDGAFRQTLVFGRDTGILAAGETP